MTDLDVSSLRNIVARRQAFYEVAPYTLVVEEPSTGRSGRTRRLHAGFDVDIYGVESLADAIRSADYLSGYAALQVLAARVVAESSCSIEVIPFSSTLILDTRRNLQPQGVMRIRITHARGLDQPSGAWEEKALRAIVAQLQDLGISFGNRRT